MTRAFPVAFLLAWPALGQFTGLASNGDGSTLYFSSTLRLHGSAQSFDAKIFRIGADGAQFFRSQDPGERIGWTWTNFYNLTGPRISTDGAVIAFSGSRPCYGGSGCLAVQTTQGTIVDGSGKVLLSAAGAVDLSPNGRYAFFFGRNTFGSLIPPAEFIDMASGTRTTVPYATGLQARHRVANDGTVAIRSGNSIRLWQTQGEQTIGGIAIASDSVREPFLFLSADAQRLVYQTASGLALYDRAAGAGQALVSGVPISAAMSDDGHVVAYIDAADSQIYLAAPRRLLTHEPDGISEVALSGDGRTVFAATGQGRLIRVDAASGSVTELVPRTPWITNSPNQPGVQTDLFDGVAPGSLIPLTGTGLSASTQSSGAPLPRALADVRIRIAGFDAVLQTVSPSLVWFQVPWEVPPQEGASLEYVSGDSPFETGPGTVDVRTIAPHTFGTADAGNGYSIYSLAAHQDWSALVTPDSPAQPGEIIHLYFNGLGPVAPGVATGEASPAQPLARIIGSLRCQFWDGDGNDSRIWFAGLAPGLVGIYQVSLQVPAGLRVSNPGIGCDFGAGSPSTIGSTFVAQ